jgi:hypothetical protein
MNAKERKSDSASRKFSSWQMAIGQMVEVIFSFWFCEVLKARSASLVFFGALLRCARVCGARNDRFVRLYGPTEVGPDTCVASASMKRMLHGIPPLLRSQTPHRLTAASS